MERISHTVLRKYYPFIIMFMTSIMALLFATKNSPLFVYNDWVDLNSFLTVGKAWGHGIIPYKDIFEQKGPVLYFIYLIASKLSNSYFGIFVLEVLNLFAISVILYKIGCFFLTRQMSLIFVFFSYIFLLTTPYFKSGGSAEEFGMLGIMYFIYLILLLQETNFNVGNKHYVFAGFFVGYLFWIKYTMIGGWIGFYITLGLILIFKKELQTLTMVIVYSLIGFLSITLPVIYYFVFKRALGELLHVYFYANMSLYPSEQGTTTMGKIINSVVMYCRHFLDSPILFIFLILGLFALIFSSKIFKNNYTLFMYSASYICLVITTLFGGKDWSYYYLILMPFACVPLLLIVMNLKPVNNFKMLLIFILSFIITVSNNNNISYSKLNPSNRSITLDNNKDGPAQIKFANIIKQEKNPTLLNYGFLDMGLYHAADVLPSNYYFEKQNIDHELLPELMNEQNRLIDEKKVMFVVVRMPYFKEVSQAPKEVRKARYDPYVPKNVLKNYDLVAEHSQFFEHDRTYQLYKVKTNAYTEKAD